MWRSQRLLSWLTTALFLFISPAALGAAIPQAQGPHGSALCERIIRDGGFRVSRNLNDYEALFGRQFTMDFVGLSQGQRWVDLGAGQAGAQLQYLREGGVAEAKAIAFERPYKVKQADPERFEFLAGRFFEDIPDAEIGQAELITDVYGVLSYTPKLGEALAKIFRLLRPGSKLYVHHFLAKLVIELPSGRELFFHEWLQTIPGLNVARAGGPDEGWNSIQVTRGEGEIGIPALELLKTEDGWPPVRVFRAAR